ncbi:MAG TPA: FkbM family methyltransferase [Solirubrobacteraceae bacterium]|nr:FkbM family methyltransferase [Solirubrobacteraceae bacterium]
MAFAQRAVGAASRRLGRPELLAVVDAGARQAEREEIGIRAVLAGALRRDATYVDIGANRGQILREAVRVAPQGRHIAFEPIPALAAEITSMFPDVDCRQMALGAAAGDAQFCHFTQLDGWSGLRRSPKVSDKRGQPKYIAVRVSTLDEELAGVTPSVIKIDVEGAELEVLEGGSAVLRDARPLVIFEHVAEAAALYGATPEGVWDRLGELGYSVFAVTGDGPFTRSEFARSDTVVNWLATPDPRPR